MTRRRASLIEQDEPGNDLDLAGFEPRRTPLKDPPDLLRQAGEVGGFRTRHAMEPAPPPAADATGPPKDGRSLRKTGRSAQFNIAVKPEDKSRFWHLAEQANVRAGGEFFQRLLDEWEKRGK